MQEIYFSFVEYLKTSTNTLPYLLLVYNNVFCKYYKIVCLRGQSLRENFILCSHPYCKYMCIKAPLVEQKFIFRTLSKLFLGNRLLRRKLFFQMDFLHSSLWVHVKGHGNYVIEHSSEISWVLYIKATAQ